VIGVFRDNEVGRRPRDLTRDIGDQAEGAQSPAIDVRVSSPANVACIFISATTSFRSAPKLLIIPTPPSQTASPGRSNSSNRVVQDADHLESHLFCHLPSWQSRAARHKRTLRQRVVEWKQEAPARPGAGGEGPAGAHWAGVLAISEFPLLKGEPISVATHVPEHRLVHVRLTDPRSCSGEESPRGSGEAPPGQGPWRRRVRPEDGPRRNSTSPLSGTGVFGKSPPPPPPRPVMRKRTSHKKSGSL
jgi:hypothetical protein